MAGEHMGEATPEVLASIFENIIASIMKTIYNEGGEFAYHRILYLSGLESGKAVTRQVKESGKLKGRELLKETLKNVGLFALGSEINVEEYSEYEVIISVKNSITAKLWKAVTGMKADHPVCSFFNGVFTGVVREIFGSEDVDGEEVECEAMGHGQCKFVIRKK